MQCVHQVYWQKWLDFHKNLKWAAERFKIEPTTSNSTRTKEKDNTMKSKTLASITLSAFSAFALNSCKSIKETEIHQAGSNLTGASGSLTKDFFTGLSSAPGTPARQRAGEILEKVFKEKLYPTIPNTGDQYAKESRERTQRILNLTIEYLKSGTQCAPSQRIRAYRGLGSQNVFFHP